MLVRTGGRTITIGVRRFQPAASELGPYSDKKTCPHAMQQRAKPNPKKDGEDTSTLAAPDMKVHAIMVINVFLTVIRWGRTAGGSKPRRA